MNKTAIKNFAIWARNKLISDIQFRAQLLGVLPDRICEPLPQSDGQTQFFDIGTRDYVTVKDDDVARRAVFVETLRAKAARTDYATAYKAIIEKVAYTWFNRLIAIRFMEVNDYLPGRVRVLSSTMAGKAEPDLVSNPFEGGLTFTEQEQDTILRFKDENRLDELFRMLFIMECQSLSEILPGLFEKKEESWQPRDYYALLLNINFTDRDGLVWHLTHDIPERDFRVRTREDDLRQAAEGIPEEEMPAGQVETIGWLYQYYNTEPKNKVFAGLKKNKKIGADDIPAATQLFTPEWIVRYMVENSLGRLWIDHLRAVEDTGILDLSQRNIRAHVEDDVLVIDSPAHVDDTTIYIDGPADFAIKGNWKYYLEEAKQESEVEEQLAAIRSRLVDLRPEDIRVIDPCCGSGHIAVYLFDVLMQIYESQGWTQRDAAQSIVQNNLYALDIDDRAAQLAYFAVMMKARQYDRRFFSRGLQPHVYAIPEWDEETRKSWSEELRNLCNLLRDGKEFGSIIDMPEMDWNALRMEVELMAYMHGQISIDSVSEETREKLRGLIEVGQAMAQKYDVVATNPPYMGAGGMGEKLSKYVKDHYPDSKSDMSTVSMERCMDMCTDFGFMSMINIPVWMFLTSYEKLRYKQLKNNTYINMIHPGRGIFGSDFGTTTFVMANHHVSGYVGSYRRLFDKQGDVETNETREQQFLVGKGSYTACQDSFEKIPGSPVAYWASNALLRAFNAHKVGDYAQPRQGFATGDNNRFLRMWQEVNWVTVNTHAVPGKHNSGKWFPCNKGGEYRKWYGNNVYLVNWENDGQEMKSFPGSVIRNPSYYFRNGTTWSTISISQMSMRYSPQGFLFESKGSVCFYNEEHDLPYILGVLNSVIVNRIMQILAPTLDFHEGPVSRIPVVYCKEQYQLICNAVNQNVDLSRADWDSFEDSWDFQVHPLIRCAAFSMEEMRKDALNHIRDMNYIEEAFVRWNNECFLRFQQLKANEEELNRIFIDIYGLQDELTPEVADKDVTVRRADLGRDIRSLISYAVGCMFGRYSLDVPGLVYAGGEWNDCFVKNPSVIDPETGKPAILAGHFVKGKDGMLHLLTFEPDTDNCLPITDEDYGLKDDVVNCFVDFIRTVYGEATLEENLDYIAKALGNKGDTSRDVIRNYFLNDFFKNHCQTYSVTGSGKRPIYWLFDSGKANGFKALVYMHRWNADTVGNLRVEYLHRMQRVYEKEIERMQDTIDNARDSREIARATKRREKLVKQLKEARDYDAKIAHVALSRVEIDLDDGVKVNYEKVQKGPDGKSLGILAKI